MAWQAVKWSSGGQAEVQELKRTPGDNPRRRYVVGGRDIQCGDRLEIQVQGCALKGRVEYNERLGYYWVWEEPEGGVVYRLPLRVGMRVVGG